MPNSRLPFSVSTESPARPDSPVQPESSVLPPAVRTDHPPSAPDARTGPRRIRKEVLTMFFRLLASFARSDAVHQARLDAYWNGPQRHLLTHSSWSVK